MLELGLIVTLNGWAFVTVSVYGDMMRPLLMGAACILFLVLGHCTALDVTSQTDFASGYTMVLAGNDNILTLVGGVDVVMTWALYSSESTRDGGFFTFVGTDATERGSVVAAAPMSPQAVVSGEEVQTFSDLDIALTTADAPYSFSLFRVSGSTQLVISRITVTGSSGASVIYAAEAYVTLEDIDITGASCIFGCGLFCVDCRDVALTDVYFGQLSSVGSAGGIYAEGAESVALTNVVCDMCGSGSGVGSCMMLIGVDECELNNATGDGGAGNSILILDGRDDGGYNGSASDCIVDVELDPYFAVSILSDDGVVCGQSQRTGSTCPVGMFLGAEGCLNCTKCDWPHVMLAFCGGMQDTVCSECPVGTNQEIENSQTCNVECVEGTYDANGLGIGATGAVDCQTCSTCAFPQITLDACNGTDDTVCSDCAIGANEQLINGYNCTVECEDGTYDLNGNGVDVSGSLNCVACGSCSFPQTTVQECTTASDTMCSSCVVGTNQEIYNAYTCDMECVEGTYDVNGLGIGATGAVDCQTCSTCAFPQITWDVCNGTDDTVCSDCAIGANEQLINGYNCTVECEDGTYDLNGNGVDVSGSLNCVACGSCSFPQTTVQECTTASDTMCSSCVVGTNQEIYNAYTCDMECVEGTYDVNGLGIGATGAVDCQTCSTCAFPQITWDVCNGTDDTVCSDCAIGANEQLINGYNCTVECEDGTYDLNGNGVDVSGSLNCVACGSCSFPQTTVQECTTASDTMCSSCVVGTNQEIYNAYTCDMECVEGTYDVNGLGIGATGAVDCQTCSTCAFPQITWDVCNGTDDTVCSDCAIGANEQLINGYNCTVECEDGTYDLNGNGVDVSGSLNCVACGSCSFPQTTVQECTTASDTMCSSCVVGTNQEIYNAYTCDVECLGQQYDVNGLGVGATGAVDCQTCSTCAFPQISLDACNGTDDTVCSDCAIGANEQLINGYNCTVECEDGTYDVNGNGVGVSGSLNCVACGSCSFPQTTVQECTTASDTMCSSCVVGTNQEIYNAYTCDMECVEGTYDVNGLGVGATGAVDCQTCSTCAFPQITWDVCNGTDDTVCSDCAIGANEQLINGYNCTVECEDGTYDLNGNGVGASGALVCTPCSVCAENEFIGQACHSDADTMCVESCAEIPNTQLTDISNCRGTCVPGFFDQGGSAVTEVALLTCITCDECSDYETVLTPCSASSDVGCSSCGFGPEHTALDHSACTATCGDGYFSATGMTGVDVASLACTPCSAACSGAVASACSATSDCVFAGCASAGTGPRMVMYGSLTFPAYCENGWILVASNNGGDNTIPQNGDRRASMYALSSSPGVNGDNPDPDRDFVIPNSRLNQVSFTEARAVVWGIDDPLCSSCPYETYLTTNHQVTTFACSMVSCCTNSAVAEGTSGYRSTFGSQHFHVDCVGHVLRDNVTSNSNQVTVGACSKDNSCTTTTTFLGHGNTENGQTYEGSYDESGNARDAHGYTTWVR